jgi:inner membrane protein
MEKTSFFDRFNHWIKNSVTIKLFSIGILILILLIPNFMLQELINERQDLHNSAVDEISSKWGGRQTIGGPVISIPYAVTLKDEKGNEEEVVRYAHFLPEELNIDGKAFPEKRYRGMYVVVLYKTILHVSGKFSFPDINKVDLKKEACRFNQAIFSMGITDLRGINDEIKCNINGQTFSFGPGILTHDILGSGISFKYPLDSAGEINFSFDINLNGSTNLNFLPFGKETKVNLSSSWNCPSFEGSFLPDNRIVNDSGFTASWKVLQLNRNYPQEGLGNFISSSESDELQIGQFGVRLMLPIDEYQKTMRSVKYCVMFIIITFLTFFFVEVLNKKRIHPIQYLLVGFAICLFYVLLLSISEHLSFGKAYIIACISIVSLITFYAKHVFKNNKLTTIFSALLILLYGFFYSLLQLEDYALLLGSLGLFIILGTIMYLTRKVSWYSQDE